MKYMSPYILQLCVQPSVMLPEAFLWKSLFDEPTLWFDKRPTKNNRPAFVHRHHHYPLWLGDRTPAEALAHVKRIDDLNEGRWVKVLSKQCDSMSFVCSHYSVV